MECNSPYKKVSAAEYVIDSSKSRENIPGMLETRWFWAQLTFGEELADTRHEEIGLDRGAPDLGLVHAQGTENAYPSNRHVLGERPSGQGRVWGSTELVGIFGLVEMDGRHAAMREKRQ